MELVQGMVAADRLLRSLDETQKRDLDYIFNTVVKRVIVSKFGANPDVAQILSTSDDVETAVSNLMVSPSAMALISGNGDSHVTSGDDSTQDDFIESEAVVCCPECSFVFIKDFKNG
jgi:hypothetical protein